MDRFVPWLIAKVGPGSLVTLLLLMAALGSAFFGLAELVIGFETALVWFPVLGGTLAGWLLGRSRLAGWKSFLLGWPALLAGHLLYYGKLSGPLGILAGRLGELILAALRWRTAGPPDPSLFLQAVNSAWASISAVLGRVSSWIGALARGASSEDPLPVVIAWSLFVWSACLWAGWIVRRRSLALPAVLPAAVALAAALNYKRENPIDLALLLGFTLFLMIAANHRRHQRRWEAQGLDYSTDIPLDLALIAVPLVASVFLAALALPSISVNQVVSAIQRWSEPQTKAIRQAGRSLGLGEPGGAAGPGGLRASPGLPRSHLLGSGPELSSQTVLQIQTGDLPPGPPEMTIQREIPRYYWRSATYDEYTGRGWKSGDLQAVAYLAGAQAIPPWETTGGITSTLALVKANGPLKYRLVQHQIRATRDLGNALYAAGLFLSADADYRALWRVAQPPITGTLPALSWLQTGDLFGIGVETRVYRVNSLITTASASELRQAGNSYPEPIASRYLSLPEGIPARVASLAREVAAAAENPYDQAIALEAYLRQIPYSLEIPAPPPGRDVVDFFLFDLRQGYCDYYASAMVVMARLVGLPARLVIGYAGGSYNPYDATYTVSEANAHSWVEIYFPRYGWNEFEPTGSLPLIDRPDRPPVAASLPPLEGASQAPLSRSLVENLRLVLAGCLRSPAWLAASVILFVAFSAEIVRTIDLLRLRRLSPGEALAHVYRRLAGRGRRLAILPAGSTPSETASALVFCLERLGQWQWLRRAFHPAGHEIRRIADLHVRSAYSAHPASLDQQIEAIQIWRRLRWRLWAARIFQKLQRTVL